MELLIDLDRAADIDRAIPGFRGVIEFAIGSVTGPGVIPAARALSCHVVESFEDHNRPIGPKMLQHRSQCRTHDAATDKCNINCRGRAGHKFLRQISDRMMMIIARWDAPCNRNGHFRSPVAQLRAQMLIKCASVSAQGRCVYAGCVQ
jgi:hypothetical protein